MTVITTIMVAPYFKAYADKYGVECTLSLDVMEEIMGTATDEEAMLTDMHEAMTSSDQDDDRSLVTVADTAPGSAFDYAIKMDTQLVSDLETSAKAALENKRGAAVIGINLIRLYGHDAIVSIFPVPGSKRWETSDNIPADKYKSVVKKEDGTTAEGERSWYGDYVEQSPLGRDLFRQRASIKGIKAGEEGPHILEEHKSLRGDKLKIVAAEAAISGKINNLKAAIVRSVNLIQRMNAFNTQTDMACELILDEGKFEDGTGVPVQSNKLVYAYDRKDNKKFNILTIGQLLALKVIEGGTYAAISGTTARAPKSGTGPTAVEVPEVNSLDMFDKVTSAYATFFDKLEEQTNSKDMKAYNALLSKLNGANTDEILLSMNQIMNSIEAILSKPGISQRLGNLIADGNKKSKAA